MHDNHGKFARSCCQIGACYGWAQHQRSSPQAVIAVSCCMTAGNPPCNAMDEFARVMNQLKKSLRTGGLLSTSGSISLIANSRAIREQREANIFVSWNQCQRFSGLLIDTGRQPLTSPLPAPRALNKNNTDTCRHVDLIIFAPS